MPFPNLLLEVGSHELEAAETLIAIARFMIIFVAARFLAELLVRVQLPTILGELVAGVIIGASGLHLVLSPEVQSNLNNGLINLISDLTSVPPPEVSHLYVDSFTNLQSWATLGLYALLFLTGLESDLEQLIAVGSQAFSVAVVGVVLPFVGGTLGLMAFFHVGTIPAIFAGAAMTATSIGITAKVFGELNFLKTREGQTVIGAAVLDDILGIVILAVVVALSAGGSLEVVPIIRLLVAAAIFVGVSLFLSKTGAPIFDWVIDRLKAPGDVVVMAFIVMGGCCFAATAMGLEAALGAFAGGLILSTSKYIHRLQEAVEPIVALFATIFFVLIGTAMDLSVLNPFDPGNREGLIMAAFLVVVAIVGKVATGWCYLSKEKTNRLVVGLGMMPRGEVGLIFLGLGSSSGVLSPPLEAAILLMVIGTTFLAPILLRLALTDQDVLPAEGTT